MPPWTEDAIGKRARAVRTQLGLTQAEVAGRIGISSEVYGRLERGVTKPRISTFLRLCEVLGVSPDALLTASSAPPWSDDGRPPELRQLVAVLEHADPLVIRRVTEVARWLRAAPTPVREEGTGKRR